VLASPRKDSALGFHNALIEAEGVNHASGWSEHGQNARFEIIVRCLREFPDPDLRVLDYGCGTGDLYERLRGSISLKNYWGVDINPAFIARAKEMLWGGPPPRFTCENVLEEASWAKMIRWKPDVVVASGVLCYRGDKQDFAELVYRLFGCASQGLVFNVLDAAVPPKNRVNTPGIYRWKRSRVLALIDACGCNSYELIHSYLHNDMTALMRKKLTHFVCA
jgi:SAM-dependent methyltransferase